MTNIDTYVAAKHWKKNGKDETDYLDTIGFVAFDNQLRITLAADEECNSVIVLTPKAARHVAMKLREFAEHVERSDFIKAANKARKEARK